MPLIPSNGSRYVGTDLEVLVSFRDAAGELVLTLTAGDITADCLKRSSDALITEAGGVTVAATAKAGVFAIGLPGAKVDEAGIYLFTASDDTATAAGGPAQAYLEVISAVPPVVLEAQRTAGQSFERFDSTRWVIPFACEDVSSYPSDRVFTVKTSARHLDAASVVEVSEQQGLTVLNRAAPVAPVVAGDGILIFDTDTSGQLTLEARATQGLAGGRLDKPQILDWQVKAYDTGSTPTRSKVVASGTIEIPAALRQDTEPPT